jgi:hypothetical protein
MNQNKILYFLKYTLLGLIIFFPFFVNAAVTLVNPIGYNDFPSLLTAIAQGVAVLIGSLSVIMIIWSGILFLVSAGDPARIQKAKSSLTWAIIGMAIAISAEVIIETIKGILGAK